MSSTLTLLAVAAMSACGGGADNAVDASADATHEGTLSFKAARAASTENWVKVANENQSFSVGTSQRVRYGQGSKWVERTMSGAGQLRWLGYTSSL